MKRLTNRSSRLALAGFCLCGSLLWWTVLRAGDTGRASELLERGRTIESVELLGEARGLFAACLQEKPDDSLCSYSFARASRYLAEIYVSAGNKKSAAQVLDAGIEQLQKALGQKETAEAHTLMADLYSLCIAVRGGLSGMRYGPKIASENKRALELDSNNAIVYAGVGRQYYHSPSMFGGNMDKAIDAFRHSLRLDPNSDETLVDLALAYKKAGNQAGFEESLKKALQINPESAIAKHLQAEGR